MDKSLIWTLGAGVGAAAMFVLHFATQGAVAGGFEGGVVGAMVGMGLAFLGTQFFMPRDLWGAAGAGDIERVKLLLEAGADINKLNSIGVTPLIDAVHMNRPAMVAFLLDRGADPNVKDKRKGSALAMAKHLNRNEIVDLLVRAGAV